MIQAATYEPISSGENELQNICIIRETRENLSRCVKEGKWRSAKPLIAGAQREFEPILKQFEPLAVTEELSQDLKSFIRCSDYHDLLRKKDYDGFHKYLQKAYQYLEKASLGATLKRGEKSVMRLLHLALSCVLIEFRRENTETDSYYSKIEKITDIAKQMIPEESVGKEYVDAETASFWCRLFYVRYLIETKRQSRREARKYLQLASRYCETQATFETKNLLETTEVISQILERDNELEHPNEKDWLKSEMEKAWLRVKEVVYVKSVNIGISDVFLKISAGHYKDALNLLKPVISYAKYDSLTQDEDPKAELEAAIAKTICRRCINAANKDELINLDVKVSKKIEDFNNRFPHRRLLLRLYYEQTLIVLLLINLEKDEAIRTEYKTRLERQIKAMNITLAKTGGRENDRAWNAQIKILEARVALHTGDYKTAEEYASAAFASIQESKLKLLQIEARITWAVVLLRQNKFERAIELLNKALEENEEKYLTTQVMIAPSEYSQPALAGLASLYLARIYIRQKDRVKALQYLELYRGEKPKIEHRWVTETLAPQVEQEVSFELFIGENTKEGQYDLDLQTKLLRKRAIETASETLKTDRILLIAEKLNISAQTLYSWMQELKQDNLMPELIKINYSATESKGDFRELLIRQKEEIELAGKMLNTSKKAKIAKYLNISRQTLYNKINILAESGLTPIL